MNNATQRDSVVSRRRIDALFAQESAGRFRGLRQLVTTPRGYVDER